MIDIFEMYEYSVAKYYPCTGQCGLFADKKNTFLKLKVESSGYPRRFRSPEDEERYVVTFFAREGF